MIEPIIIDSFAGGGGASTGIEIALGRSPDIAINHNPAALALHEANHPQTLHISENVYRIDPLDYLRGAHVGLAWFSPDCKHFSKAKGGKPTKDRHGHVEATLDVPPFTPAHADRARQVAAFLRSYGFWDDREFVTISAGGVTYVIVDIGMRMLAPRELYLAQGFPENYEIERGIDGTVFSKSVQVSCCGNSVCPPVAAALVAANCGHLAIQREAAE